MRQAATAMMVGFFLALTQFESGSAWAADPAGKIAQAGRLLEAKAYSQAATLLEDLLLEADPKERRSILDLLRRSYQALARDAKAAGDERKAAQFLDDIAIIDRSSRPTASVAKSSEAKPLTAAVTPKPRGQGPETSGTRAPKSLPPSPRQPRSELVRGSAPRTPPEPDLHSAPAKTPPLATLGPLPKPLDLSRASLSDATGKPPTAAAARSTSPREQGGATGTAKETPAAVASKGPAQTGVVEGSPRPGPSRPKTPAISLAEADRLYSAGRYQEAGRCYAALARENGLPAHRKEHWAYCRMVDVARRINLRPQSAAEWDAIASEIANIQRLTPNIWYGEYLRNKVAELRLNGRRSPAKSDNLVVRASAPDENQPKPEQEPRRFPRLFGRSRAGPITQPDAKVAAAAPSSTGELPLKLPGGSSEPATSLALDGGRENDRSPAGKDLGARSQPAQVAAGNRAATDSAGVAWETYDTPNFRVFHQNPRLAEAAGNAAEAVRTAQGKRWGSPAAQRPWTPRCDLYLYPSGKVFARDTSQPENSPGFSTMTVNGNRVVARRVNLRADHPLLVTAILPHEVTHVVLADLFTTQQIPRWADEGIAVLAEPDSEQEIRAAELQDPLESGRVFELRKLMAMDYRDAKDWGLYYAQSASLTRFLVERGAPEEFVQFIQNSQRDGVEAALRGTYGFADMAELQKRWSEYARERFITIKEARRDPGSQPGLIELK